MYSNIRHFAGLDALRFFAAYGVVLHHAEQIRRKAGLAHLKDYSFFNNGGLAVSFFFVLSGFLITYLLIREREETGQIKVRHFYMRRVLRIWPLYYLLVFLGLIVVPGLAQAGLVKYELPFAPGEVWYYYVFFAPFLVNLLYAPTFLDPLWSIGVEELFYLFWAPLVQVFWRMVPQLCLAVIALKFLALKVALPGFWLELARSLQFEAMAIGGLTAWWLYYMQREPLERGWLFSKMTQVFILAFLGVRIGANKWMFNHVPLYAGFMESRWAAPLLFSCLFAWLIVNVSLNAGSLIPLRNRLLDYLGRVSYGIYMYHMLVVFMLVQAAKPLLAALPRGLDSLVFYAAATVGVVGISAISKTMLENPILRLKKRFE